jgi:hypothetical protein
MAGAQTDSTPRYVATLGIAQCRCRRTAEHNGGPPLEPRRPGRCAFAVPSIGPRAAAGCCRLVASSPARSEHIGTSWPSGCTDKPSIGVTHAICGRTGPVYWTSIHGRLADVVETPHFSAGLLAVISRRLSRSGTYAPLRPGHPPDRPTSVRGSIQSASVSRAVIQLTDMARLPRLDCCKRKNQVGASTLPVNGWRRRF